MGRLEKRIKIRELGEEEGMGRLEKRLKGRKLGEEEGMKMSKILQSLVNQSCRMTFDEEWYGDAVLPVGATLVTVLEVDEQWIKISYQDKKKGEVTKIVRIERVEGIEPLKE